MALTNEQIVAKNFKEFYNRILPYLNQAEPDNGFTPVGTVITVMGSHAPKNYLLCDGTVYSLAEYPDLAGLFETEFGASNYFGGDGTTTFAVPDLTGTNLTDGCFCIAYKNIVIRTSGGGGTGDYNDLENLPQIENVELKGNKSLSDLGIQPELTTGDGIDISVANEIALDPMPAADMSNILTPLPSATSTITKYSTEEQIVGQWLDGKPLYQKTFSKTSGLVNDTWQIIGDIPTGAVPETIVSVSGVCYASSAGILLPVPCYSNNESVSISIHNGGIDLNPSRTNTTWGFVLVTVQYTKTTD